MNGFVDRSWASNLTAVGCHTAVVTSGSNCVWEDVHIRGASSLFLFRTASAIECMVNRVGSGLNNSFEIFVHGIIDSEHGYHVKLHQGTVRNVVNVRQWPAPSQVLTVAFVAGAVIEGHSNGIAHSLPTCYGSPNTCGCPAACPNLTAATRVGSDNVVNVRVRTGTPVCSGDCSRNAVNQLNATMLAPAPLALPPPCKGYAVSAAGDPSCNGCYHVQRGRGEYVLDDEHILYADGGVWRIGRPGRHVSYVAGTSTADGPPLTAASWQCADEAAPGYPGGIHGAACPGPALISHQPPLPPPAPPRPGELTVFEFPCLLACVGV